MLAQKCMEGGTEAADWRGWVIDTSVKGGLSPWFRPGYPGVKADGVKRFEVNAEMIDAVQVYLDVVREIAEESTEFEIEKRLDISNIVAGVYGTGDAIAYREAPTRRVTIADLKYGKGVAVDVKENEQELTYAIGVVKRYHNRGVDEVELVIVQPRAPHRDGPVRRWTTDVVGLYEHAMALQDAEERTRDPDAPLVPGDHCKFCKAVAICPALRDRVWRITGSSRNVLGTLTMADPAKYDAEALAQALKDRELVATWVKGVEKFGHSEALAGRVAPGWKLVAGRSSRSFKDEEEAALTLQIAGIEKDDIYETKMRSPAQIEVLIPKKERSAFMAELVVKTPGKPALAPLDDDRPSIDPGAARGFDAVEIEER